MSTFAYAALTSARERAGLGVPPNAAGSPASEYVDVLAALVPAEVLTLHAFVVSATTTVTGTTTTITNVKVLAWMFWVLIALALLFYAGGRRFAKKWDRLDRWRMLIPPLAFVCWTMLQRTTAFDGFCESIGAPMDPVVRVVIPAVAAVVLGWFAKNMVYNPNA
jgi:hypothetical protein